MIAFFLFVVSVVLIRCLFVIASLRKTKAEKEITISNLNTRIYSLEKELNDIDTELKNQIRRKALQSTATEEQITSYTNRLNMLRVLNTQTDNEIQELNQQKTLTEKKLFEAQRSFLLMAQSIQQDFDSLSAEQPQKFTYIASLMADFLTLNIKNAEEHLNSSKKYHERQRAAKINEIRQKTNEILSKYKEAQYQLEYLLQIYPELNDIINYDYSENLSFDDINSNFEIFNDDPISKYISRTEWEELTESQRNQLALDRYLSRNKSNWEIGRDYELYIAYQYELHGYSVDTFGSYMRLNDLGRDLIAKKDKKIKIIQCKYWSAKKEIHENHICQLFGTVICYCIENNLSTDDVEAVFVTSTVLSLKAKEFAEMLKIKVIENMPLKDFPRIKCNIGHDEFGQTQIYHLPIDPLYDRVKISKKGECYCYTVSEAEELGFRRAYRWHGH